MSEEPLGSVDRWSFLALAAAGAGAGRTTASRTWYASWTRRWVGSWPRWTSTLDWTATRGMVKGEWYPWTEDILRMGPRMPAPEPTDSLRFGEYLARTACTECHGNELEGEMGGPPDLVVAAAYSRENFARLMRTGVAVGERDLRTMSVVARGRFSHFTGAEIRALHAYLRERAARASRLR